MLELYRHLGQRFLKLGEAPLAREVAHTALQLAEKDERGRPRLLWSDDVSLRQIHALALARSGNPTDAQRELLKLRSEGHADEETLGVLARTYKDQAFQYPVNDAEWRRLVDIALRQYYEAYTNPARYWTGINVATLHRLLGESSKAEEVAVEVRAHCMADLGDLRTSGAPGEGTYWHLATLGEAALVMADFALAGQYYQQAHSVAPKNYGDLNASRRHARLLLEYWTAEGQLTDSDAGLLDDWLPLPRVVVFAEHTIDHPDRPSPRFPSELQRPVRETIHELLKVHRAQIGYSSAACGADLLFQEVIQQLGGESRIVVPYDAEQFAADSVNFADDDWKERYNTVCRKNSTCGSLFTPDRC